MICRLRLLILTNLLLLISIRLLHHKFLGSTSTGTAIIWSFAIIVVYGLFLLNSIHYNLPVLLFLMTSSIIVLSLRRLVMWSIISIRLIILLILRMLYLAILLCVISILWFWLFLEINWRRYLRNLIHDDSLRTPSEITICSIAQNFIPLSSYFAISDFWKTLSYCVN